ncbi:MAG TPA: hypothetical protein VEB42_13805 [Chitinophagaceae bacterium]|nr:hypothetical protein [Chitinophagaceae bacterium]
MAGTRIPVPKKVSKANKVRVDKVARAVWDRDKVVWEVQTVIQPVDPRAEAARVVAWVPVKEGMIYKSVD